MVGTSTLWVALFHALLPLPLLVTTCTVGAAVQRNGPSRSLLAEVQTYCLADVLSFAVTAGQCTLLLNLLVLQVLTWKPPKNTSTGAAGPSSLGGRLMVTDFATSLKLPVYNSLCASSLSAMTMGHTVGSAGATAPVSSAALVNVQVAASASAE